MLTSTRLDGRTSTGLLILLPELAVKKAKASDKATTWDELVGLFEWDDGGEEAAPTFLPTHSADGDRVAAKKAVARRRRRRSNPPCFTSRRGFDKTLTDTAATSRLRWCSGHTVPSCDQVSSMRSFSLGIEEEYQTVDPESRDLRSHIATEMLAEGKLRLEERVKAEMHQSVIEVGTRVCKNIQEAQEDLFDLRRNMIRLAEKHGLVLVAGATHPFADWRVQEIYPDPRYAQVVEDLQLVARANLIFGLHVHVGIEDREAAIRIMNSLRYFLPHILALSTNSPFWLGMETGYKSYRAKVFENFPRTNLPDSFSSYSEFENYVNLLIKTNSIDNAKKIWWDVRPHPFFDTIEVRICDIPLRAHETIAIAALIQATASKLWHLHSHATRTSGSTRGRC